MSRGTPSPRPPPMPPVLQLVAVLQEMLGGEGRAAAQLAMYCWPLRQAPLPRLLQACPLNCPPRFISGLVLITEGAGRDVVVKVGEGEGEKDGVLEGDSEEVLERVGLRDGEGVAVARAALPSLYNIAPAATTISLFAASAGLPLTGLGRASFHS